MFDIDYSIDFTRLLNPYDSNNTMNDCSAIINIPVDYDLNDCVFLQFQNKHLNISEYQSKFDKFDNKAYIPINKNMASIYQDNLNHVIYNKRIHDIILEVLDHICLISFGNIISLNTAHVKLLFDTMYKFVDVILSKDFDDITIYDCKEITNEMFGRKKDTNCSKKAITTVEKLIHNEINEKRLCFDVAFVMLYFRLRNELFYLLWDKNTFIANYSFMLTTNDITPNEIDTLLNFRNMMVVALQIIPTSGKKGYLLDIITRIVEGYHKKYVTGSGATNETLRRVKIFEIEGKIDKRMCTKK